MKISKIIKLISITISGLFIISSPTYADNLDYNVVVKPSLKITLSDTNPSLNLNPTNHAFDSTNITSTVSTNHPNGYKLYISTAEGSGGTSGTELVNTTNSTYTIPTLPSTETGYDTTTFPTNYWGYKLDTTSTEYLPYSSNTLINQDTTATNGTESTITFAAKIDYNKPAGLYNLTFDLKTIPIVTQEYMQNMDPSVCTETPTIVIDKRDEQIYTIRRIGDAGCWMIDNLRFTGTELSSSTSNISLEYTDSNPYKVNGVGQYQDLTSGNSYTEARIHAGVDNYNNPTVWYNYAATSAGTIIGSSISSDTVNDICPFHWRLPTNAESTKLKTNTSTNHDIFNSVAGGYYHSGEPRLTGSGLWWGSTVYSDTEQYYFGYNGNKLYTQPNGARFDGFYIRCLLQE